MFATLANLLRALLPQPQTYEDYYTVNGWLIYKKLVPILLCVVLLLVLVLGFYLVDLFRTEDTDLSIPVFYIQDEALKKFSGEAILVDADREVLYQGQVVQGKRLGEGVAFSPSDQTVVYEGEFLDDCYSGKGKQYRLNQLVYEGSFLEGLYSGEGTLYASPQIVRYQGQFAKGVYQGAGVLYHPDGKQILYEGSFAGGLYEGDGALYRADGSLLYTGGFRKGIYSGAGAEYSAQGEIIYAGEFKNGLRDGMGSLYHEDGIRLTFAGQFVKGVPARTGSLFNRQGQLLFSGAIYDGQADYLSLLGLPITEIGKQVSELPVIYYGSGYVGYLYRELGFALICRYDYTAEVSLAADSFYDRLLSSYAAGSDYGIGGGGINSQAAEDFTAAPPDAAASSSGVPAGTELFASPEDNLVADTMLVVGSRLWAQIPQAQGVAVEKSEQTGLEAFMESRVASIENPAVLLESEPVVLRRGDHLYEVVDMESTVPYDGVGHYQDTISFYYRAASLEKGAIPAVVLCSKARFGG